MITLLAQNLGISWSIPNLLILIVAIAAGVALMMWPYASLG